jgi:hypothetical protein
MGDFAFVLASKWKDASLEGEENDFHGQALNIASMNERDQKMNLVI